MSRLTEKLGIPRTSLDRQINENNLKATTVVAICDMWPSVSLEWLMTGMGEMLLDQDSPEMQVEKLKRKIRGLERQQREDAERIDGLKKALRTRAVFERRR